MRTTSSLTLNDFAMGLVEPVNAFRDKCSLIKTLHDSHFIGEDDESKIEGCDESQCDDISLIAMMSQRIASDSPEMASALESDVGGIVTSIPLPTHLEPFFAYE